MERKSVIAGIGCISSVGNNSQEFIENLDSNLGNNNNCYMIPDFKYCDDRVNKVLPRLDKSCKLLLKATDEALTGIDIDQFDKNRIGVIIGTTFGVVNSQKIYLEKLYKRGVGFPLDFQHTANNLLSGIISYKYKIRGLNFTIMSGITAGLDALTIANNLILSNQLDVAIVGGVDVISSYTIAFYEEMKAEKFLQSNFIYGEGCGVVVLAALEKIKDKGSIKGMIKSLEQGNYYKTNDIEDELGNILDNSRYDLYFPNLNYSIIDFHELNVLEKQNVENIINIKSIIGECGAGTGILQVIYGTKFNYATAIIFNVCYLGQFSCLQLMNSVV